MASALLPSTPWTASQFLDLLPALGKLRIISVCGPSVFEALCEAGPYDERGGSLNMVTDAFHWHLATHRVVHLQSRDTIHQRSGRRVILFELRESAEDSPFLRIYVHRAPQTEFDPDVAERFAAAHRELADGVFLLKENEQS